MATTFRETDQLDSKVVSNLNHGNAQVAAIHVQKNQRPAWQPMVIEML
jgi:hypothetical protein